MVRQTMGKQHLPVLLTACGRPVPPLDCPQGRYSRCTDLALLALLTHVTLCIGSCCSQLLSSASAGADSYQSQILDAAETALFNSQTASNDNVLTTLANMTSLVVCASTVVGFGACK